MTLNLNLNRILIFYCLSIIILNILVILLQFNGSGWDFNIYLSALKVWVSGGNPYLVQSIQHYDQTELTFVYPPITLIFFKILFFSQNKIIYYIYWISALLLTFFIVKKTDNNFQPLLFMTLLITGFTATIWNFITGNIGLLELLIFALAIFYLVQKNSYYIPAILITLIGFVKIIPIFLTCLFLLTPQTNKEKLKVISTILILFCSLSVVSWLLFPNLTIYYYLSITGGLSQYTPIAESGGISNPSSLFLFENISNLFIKNNLYFSLVLFVAYATFILSIFLRYIKKVYRDFLEIFCVGTLAIFLIVPQMKPYTFTLAIIPVYFLIKNHDIRKRLVSLLIISFLPFAAFMILYNNTNVFIYSILSYIQLISLLIFYLYYCFTFDTNLPTNSKNI